MNLFRRKSSDNHAAIQAVPSPVKSQHPFSLINGYIPFSQAQLRLYASLREAIPVIDAAIYKTVRLVGGFKIECEDKVLEHEINNFLDNIQVNSCSNGASNFMTSYLEQLITYGTAIGEIVPKSSGDGVAALYNVSLEDVEFRSSGNPLNVDIYSRNFGDGSTPVKYPELVLTSVLNPEPGSLYGTSILKGLPFVSSILLKIFHTIGQNWERVGNIRFAVTYKPGNDASEKAFTKERAMQIASEWQNAMKGEGISDFISVGDVNIKVIGSDNQILDSNVPVRQIMEQIVAKLSIPPFLLGLSWSTTETMSTQQAYILTNELQAYRRIVNPVISKICNTWLKLNGYSTDFNIVWDQITLKDDVRYANARLNLAKALEIEHKIQEKTRKEEF